MNKTSKVIASIIIMFLSIISYVCFLNWLSAASKLDSFKKEAIENGYAYYSVDLNANVSFNWKK